MLIQDNTVLEGKLPHFGGQTTHSPANHSELAGTLASVEILEWPK